MQIARFLHIAGVPILLPLSFLVSPPPLLPIVACHAGYILMHLMTFVFLTCGVVMMIAPSTCVLLKYWTIDRCSSDVPGGVSMTR